LTNHIVSVNCGLWSVFVNKIILAYQNEVSTTAFLPQWQIWCTWSSWNQFHRDIEGWQKYLNIFCKAIIQLLRMDVVGVILQNLRWNLDFNELWQYSTVGFIMCLKKQVGTFLLFCNPSSDTWQIQARQLEEWTCGGEAPVPDSL
jgi:hypothetical protein